ncbi:hypothetical protein MJO10_31290, partial [Salmonella enterica subsp. enterica serovar Anatum]|nr:hypothetical protein [Salmonella enterica subsp. enterica serovar Anatum]
MLKDKQLNFVACGLKSAYVSKNAPETFVALMAKHYHRLQPVFIQGYTALLNPHYLDASLLVFVEITLNRGAPDVFEQFNAAVQ